MPSVCGLTGENLKAGELSSVELGGDSATLREDLTTVGDLTGDGYLDAVAVIECKVSGAGLAHVLLLYGAPVGDLVLLSKLDTWEIVRARNAIASLRMRAETVVVSAAATGPGDPLCCPSRTVRFEISWDGNALLYTDPVDVGRATDPPSPPAQTGALALEEGETANFRYFDVTVLEHRVAPNGVEGGNIYGARVEVCYTHQHPDANADGSTRTSSDPWTFGWVHGPDVTWLLDEPPFSSLSDHWVPAYQERVLAVGECNSGWLAVEFHDTAYAAHIGVRYAPGDFDFSGTWTWN